MAEIGLVPMLPTIAEGATLVMPLLERIAKFPAVPSKTLAGPIAPATATGSKKPAGIVGIATTTGVGVTTGTTVGTTTGVGVTTGSSVGTTTGVGTGTGTGSSAASAARWRSS